jgi:hypothetical protein
MISPRHTETSVPIQFNTQEMQECLKNSDTYEKDTFIIKQLTDFDQYRQEEEYVPAEEDYVFALQNKDPQAPFVGVVNYHFKREGYCLNTFTNGDIYFGHYNNDLRNKQGLYSFKPSKNDNKLYSQFYYGSWEKDLISGKGIYLWLKENGDITPFSDYDKANFEAFVGTSLEGNFQKGALLCKNGNNKFIYYGNISLKGKKEGNKCFYYSANSEKLCYGTFKDDIFVEGYVGKFNNKGKLEDLIIYKKEEGKNAKGEKIKIKSDDSIVNTLEKIREIILWKDHFKMIYEEFGKIIKFRDEKMYDIKSITTDEYGKIMNCFKFNKITLYEDIEMILGF